MYTTLLLLTLVTAKAPALGALDFRVTGNAECKRLFEVGALQLHSFEYGDAHKSFAAAAKADPSCAMAHWGDAMAYSHPLWGEERKPDAVAALARITNENVLTPNERAHIRAARTLFGEGDTLTRMEAWLRVTEQNARELPGDDELALQQALALIANSDRYTNIRRLMQATAIATEVAARRPNHPGATHYWIHACDTPDHAVLALPAARVYARIAPSAEHARHMPSHIFVQLGMWNDAAASNESAWGATLERLKTRDTGEVKPGFHAYSWLGAAYLELGRASDARVIIDDMARRLRGADSAESRFDYAGLVRKYVTDTGRWSEAASLFAVMQAPLVEPGESGDSLGCAMHTPGSGAARPPFGLVARARMQITLAEAAMHAGDEAEAQRQTDALADTAKAMSAWKATMPAMMIENFARAGETLRVGARAFATKTPKDWANAIGAAQRWAEVHDKRDILGPAFDPPVGVFVAELQMAAGRSAEALATFEATNKRMTGYGRALIGAARAAQTTGKTTLAQAHYAALATQWSATNADREGVAEARAAAERK